MNPVSRYIDTGETTLHCLEWENDGPPALLLHGASFCASVWSSMGRMLSKKFRVLTLDLRGHGDSGKPPGIIKPLTSDGKASSFNGLHRINSKPTTDKHSLVSSYRK